MSSTAAEIFPIEQNLEDYPPLRLIQGMGVAASGDEVGKPELYAMPSHAEKQLSIDVTRLPEDEALREKVDRNIHLIGKAATNEVIVQEVGPEVPKFTNLKEALDAARKGDEEALQYVWTNVFSDMKERTWKAGIVLKTRIKRGKSGEHVQHGQNIGTVHTNTFLYAADTPEMHSRARYEAYNSARTQHHDREGRLRDNWLVVFSLCETGKTDDDLKEMGFFEDTKSCAIQAVTAEGNDLPLESGFVAGAAQRGAERHDVQTIIKIGAMFGVDYSGMSTAEIIGRPLLIPKKFMPNGVVDLIKLYDVLAGGTFFGEAKPVQDYEEYLKQCEERDAELVPTAHLITNQLVAEKISTPQAAIQRLHELSEYHMVKHAVTDKTVNPRVFGEVSAGYIEEARLHYELGNEELAKTAIKRAQDTADSSSCPTAVKNELNGSTDNEKALSGLEKKRSRKGRIRCIKCREVVSKAVVTKKEGYLCCPKCSYEIEVCTNKVVHKSNAALTNISLFSDSENPEQPDKLAKVTNIDKRIHQSEKHALELAA